MMPEMKLEIAAALTFIVWLPLPLRAADPVAVPGTADVVAARAWDLLMPPQHFWDTTAPLSQWKILETFPTDQACRRRIRSGYLITQPDSPPPYRPMNTPDARGHHYVTGSGGFLSCTREISALRRQRRSSPEGSPVMRRHGAAHLA
jgi:hypothetical protein